MTLLPRLPTARVARMTTGPSEGADRSCFRARPRRASAPGAGSGRPRRYIGGVHRSLCGRVIALLMAFLASFSAPGAALAHGTAHHREHHDDRAMRTSHRDGAHEHDGGHSHHVHGTAEAVPSDDRPVAGTAVVSQVTASHDDPDGSHGHPTLDLPVRPRVELAVILPLLAVATLIATPETDVASGTPVPHAALPRPDPDAAPPPRTRAPPLR